VALDCCLRDYHSCLGVQLDSELDDMLIRGKRSQRFQYCANSRSCGLKRLIQALPGLKHPNLVAPNALRDSAVFRDLNEHRALSGFELNDLGHTNRL